MTRERQGKASGDLIKSVLIGFGASLIVMAAGCALTAALIQTGRIPENAIRYCAWAICAVSACAGCRLAMITAKRAALPVSLACAALLLCAMAIVRTAFHFQGGAAWPAVLLITAAALTAPFLRRSRRGRRR